MSSLANILVTIQVDSSGVAPALAGVQTSLTTATSSFQNLGNMVRNVGLDLTRAGVSLGVGLTAPLVALGSTSIKAATDFDLSMKRVLALMADVADQFEGPFREAVRSLSVEMGVNAVKATEALYDIISADIPPENAIDFLKTSSKAAIAGLTDTQTATNALRTVIKTYGMDMSKAAEVSDVLFQGVNKGIFTFEQLTAAMGQALPIAQTLNIDYKEIIASGASLSQTGLTASRSFVFLKQAVNSLLKPTADMAKLFKALGVATGKELIEKFGGVVPAFQALRDVSRDSADVLSKAFGRVQGFQAMLGLTGPNLQRTTGFIDLMNNSLGSTEKAYAKIDESASRTFDRLKARFEDLKITLGEALLPFALRAVEVLKPIIERLKEMAEAFTKLPKPTQEFLVKIGLIAAAAGPALAFIGLIATGVGNLINVFGAAGGAVSKLLTPLGGLSNVMAPLARVVPLVAAAFAAFKAGQIVGEWNQLGQTATQLWGAVKALAEAVGEALATAFDLMVVAAIPAVALLRELWNEIVQPLAAFILNNLVSALQTMSAALRLAQENLPQVVFFLKEMVDAIGPEALSIWEKFVKANEIFWGKITDLAEKAWSSVTESFAKITATIDKAWDGLLERTEFAWAPVISFLSKVWEKVRGPFDRFIDGIIERWNKFIDFFKEKFKFIEEAWERAGKKAEEANRRTLDLGQKSFTGMANAAKQAAASIAKAYETSFAAQEEAEKKAAAAAERAAVSTRELKKQQAELKALTIKIKDAVSDLPKSVDEFTESVSRLPPEWQKAADRIARLKELLSDIEIRQQHVNKASRAQVGILKDAITEQEKLFEAFKKTDIENSFKRLNDELSKPGKVLLEGFKDVPSVVQDANKELLEMGKQVREIDEGFKKSGIQSTKFFNDRRDEAEKLYRSLAKMDEEDLRRIGLSLQDRTRAWIAYETARQEANLKSGIVVTENEKKILNEVRASLGEQQTRFSKLGESWNKLGKEISTIINDLTRDLAKAIVAGKDFGDVMTQAWRSLRDAITRIFIKDALGELTKAIGIADFSFTKLIDKMKGLFGVGKTAGNVVDAAKHAGETAAKTAEAAKRAADVANQAADASKNVASTASKVSSALSSAASTAVSTLSKVAGAINVVTGAVQAVFSALSFFQGRRMEKDIGRIEVTTRGILNQTISLQEMFNLYLPNLEIIVEFLTGTFISAFASLMTTIEEIRDILRDRLRGIPGGDPTQVPGETPVPGEEEGIPPLSEEEEEIRRKTEELAKALPNLKEGAEELADTMNGVANTMNTATSNLSETLPPFQEQGTILEEKIPEQLKESGEKIEKTGKEATKTVANTFDNIARETEQGTKHFAGLMINTENKILGSVSSLGTRLADTVTGVAGIMSDSVNSAFISMSSIEAQIRDLENRLRTGTSDPDFVIRKLQDLRRQQDAFTFGPFGAPPPVNLPGIAAFPLTRDPKTGQLNTGASANQFNLTVNVNNADAKKVANTMITEFRTRGVDI